MAFGGYLIRLGGPDGLDLPIQCMKYETYKVTRNQVDLDSTRDSGTGMLHRKFLKFCAKIEFNVPYMTGEQHERMMNLIQQFIVDQNRHDITIEYWDPEYSVYRTAFCYMPDINWTIRNVDQKVHRLNYGETRMAFIEY